MPGAGPTQARRSQHKRARLVLELFAAGVEVPEIAQRTTLKPPNVRRILRDAGIDVSKPETERITA